MTFIALVPAIYTNVKQYGAVGDGKIVSDGAITTGTPTLTSASAAFTAADVGKQITVNGAGAAAANLNTTISAYVNATTVTLTANAGTTVTAAVTFYATDDTTAIAAARSAANAAGGGVAFYPPGTYLTGSQTLYSNVTDMGVGPSASIIKLKAGANTDLFSAQTSSINLAAVNAASTNGTLSGFGIQGITLDGNKANQTSGTSYPLRVYGYNFILRDVEVLNGYSGGVLVDWNGNLGADMESTWRNVRIHDCNAIGLQLGGPHDSRFDNVLVYLNGSTNIHIAPNAQGMLFHRCHPYAPPNVAHIANWLIEADGCQLSDCTGDGAFGVNVAIIAGHVSWQGGIIIGQTPNQGSAIGIQLGQNAGNTPFTGQVKQAAGVTTAYIADNCTINTMVWYQLGGSLDCESETNNTIVLTCKQTSGSAIIGPNSPLINSTDNYLIHVEGLTADGTVAKGGGMQVSGSANPLFLVKDTTNNTTPFSVDAYHDTVGIVASPNSSIAALITTGSDSKKGLVIYPNSATQSADLLEIQDQNFANIFAIASLNGGGGNMGLGTAVNTGILLLASPFSNTMKGLVIYPHSSSQSATLLEIENSSFTPVFTVDLNGAMLLNGGSTMRSGSGAPSAGVGSNGDYYFRSDTPGTSYQQVYIKIAGAWVPMVGAPIQSASAAATATSGTITTAGVSSARIAPTANITGVILQAGTVAGQNVQVVNESAFTIVFAASGTSHVASGILCQINPLTAMTFVYDSVTALWYQSDTLTLPVQSATAVAIAASGAIATAGLAVSRLAPTAARSGITMQAGTYAGQQCFVINESAFVLTYNATPATSLIANSAVVTTLPVTSGRLFCWDSSTSLWY